MKSIMVLLASPLFAGLVYAQDHGARDSLIIETVYAEIGDSTSDVKIYATCDDSVVFYNMPLAWYPDSGESIFPVDVSYLYPISYWDEHYDSVLYNQGYIRMLGWADGGAPDPILFTNNLRVHCWTLHFAIDSLAEPQIVRIDTTFDPINGSILFGLYYGVDTLTPEFTPGAIYYGITSEAGDNNQTMARNFSLEKNYPNPFNASTTIEFSLTEETQVELSVYNILGQKVAVLFEGQKAAGNHTITWDAGDLPSGVYFARMETGDSSKNIKMVLLK